ncbi:MAG TPA: hypothetical protein VKU00_30540, partial [Chthonomonadaceae bacterium]|nr:hypothetical protein [Chthonomonadaceae bacterium]
AIESTPDRIVLHCFAGCDTERDIMPAMGLPMTALFPPRQATLPNRDRKIVETYDYTDEDGNRLYQVVRYDPKDFRQRRPDGKGGWQWSMNGSRRVLYRLPELLEDLEAGRPVALPEGERDVDAARALGVPATCNCGGAGQWRPEYSEMLQGADVIIMPDNDQAGWKHCLKVGTSLQGRARSVRVLELPGLPDKGDVSDWIKQGGTKEEMLRLMEAAPLFDAAEVLVRIDRDEGTQAVPSDPNSLLSITRRMLSEELHGLADVLPSGGLTYKKGLPEKEIDRACGIVSHFHGQLDDAKKWDLVDCWLAARPFVKWGEYGTTRKRLFGPRYASQLANWLSQIRPFLEEDSEGRIVRDRCRRRLPLWVHEEAGKLLDEEKQDTVLDTFEACGSLSMDEVKHLISTLAPPQVGSPSSERKSSPDVFNVVTSVLLSEAKRQRATLEDVARLRGEGWIMTHLATALQLLIKGLTDAANASDHCEDRPPNFQRSEKSSTCLSTTFPHESAFGPDDESYWQSLYDAVPEPEESGPPEEDCEDVAPSGIRLTPTPTQIHHARLLAEGRQRGKEARKPENDIGGHEANFQADYWGALAEVVVRHWLESLGLRPAGELLSRYHVPAPDLKLAGINYEVKCSPPSRPFLSINKRQHDDPARRCNYYLPVLFLNEKTLLVCEPIPHVAVDGWERAKGHSEYYRIRRECLAPLVSLEAITTLAASQRRPLPEKPHVQPPDLDDRRRKIESDLQRLCGFDPGNCTADLMARRSAA